MRESGLFMDILEGLNELSFRLVGNLYQRCEGIDEEECSGQFSRPPVHDGVGLDHERVGEVDDV